MTSPSSSSFSPLPRSPLFTPIPELDVEADDDDPPPPPPTATATATTTTTLPKSPESSTKSVDCNKCRPSSRREKPTSSVAPLPLPSPGVIRSLLSSLSLRSPSDQDLPRKLLLASRLRDEAILEASTLREKLARLESDLARSPRSFPHLDALLRAVSEARTMARHLARSLSAELPARALDRVGPCRKGNPKTPLFCLEALLNRIFYEGFESSAFERGGPDRILDPFARSDSNRAAYETLKGLTWEEVLSKGTRYYSDGLSGFCDRKMSEVVAMLGLVRAWPESLLQAFFGAAKAVWLVHLLAWSVHPALPIFRVGVGTRFDPGYMEDVGIDRSQDGLTGTVQLLVAPGFYVDRSVIRCKVLCMYSGSCRVGEAREEVAGHVERRR